MAKQLGDIEISPQDDRSYRAIELESNGMQVLLIQDKTTDKAACALDVGVGSLFDGDVEGLAHFCEHMLFLGTEKFPDEAAYNKYLNQNGGHSNAYTDMDHTNYFFDVSHEHLEGAMDRFAQFFVSPLFTEGATFREMQAVDSENSKNLQQDAWRLHQLHCGAAKEGHPIRKFRCGSLKTLQDDPKDRGVDIRERLLAFHSKYYSSSIMKLVVLGREDLDVLQRMVESRFSDVKNLGIQQPIIPGCPFGPSELSEMITVVPVMELRILQIFWPLPPMRHHYLKGPAKYVSHLLGHEGEGSILSYLRAKGWANELSAGPQFDNAEWSSMDVSVELTEAGLEHVHDVIQVIYRYIHVIRSAGPQKWVWDEMRQTADNAFRFLNKQEPTHYTSSLSVRMQKFPPQHFVSGVHLVRDYDPDLISEVMSRLTPSNMLVMVAAKAYAGKTNLVEPWYGTSYDKEKLEKEKLKPFEEVTQPLPEEGCDGVPKLHLPKPNDFIPSDFTLLTPKLQGLKAPVVVREEPGRVRLWFKNDDEQFKQPKLYYQLMLVTPVISESPSSSVLTEMATRLVTENLTEYSYYAALAGLHYRVSSHTLENCVCVTVQGYNHKLPVLVKTILEALAKLTVDDEALYDRLKDRMVKDYQNQALNQPYQLAICEARHLLVAPYGNKDKLEAVQAMTPAQLRAFLPRLWEQLRLESLVYGNATEEAATQLADLAHEVLKPQPLSRAVMGGMGFRVVMLNADEEVEHMTAAENKEEQNHGIQVIYQLGPQEVCLSARVDLLVLLLKDEAFDKLRTKEQLGYIVFCTLSAANRHILGLSFIVQTTHEPTHVQSRIENFLTFVRGYIEALSAEEYATNVQALVDQKLEKAKNYLEQGNRWWNEIEKGSYIFDRAEREADEVKKITKEDLLAFFDRHIAESAPERRKLTVTVYGSSHPLPTSTDAIESANKPAETTTDSANQAPAAESEKAPATTEDDENGRKGRTVRKRVVVKDVYGFKRARSLYAQRPEAIIEPAVLP